MREASDDKALLERLGIRESLPSLSIPKALIERVARERNLWNASFAPLLRKVSRVVCLTRLDASLFPGLQAEGTCKGIDLLRIDSEGLGDAEWQILGGLLISLVRLDDVLLLFLDTYSQRLCAAWRQNKTCMIIPLTEELDLGARLRAALPCKVGRAFTALVEPFGQVYRERRVRQLSRRLNAAKSEAERQRLLQELSVLQP